MPAPKEKKTREREGSLVPRLRPNAPMPRPKKGDVVQIESRRAEEVATEGLAASYLGRGLFEIQSIPCFSVGVRLGDVVRCSLPARGRPVLLEVVRSSGERTIGISFGSRTPQRTESAVLRALARLGATAGECFTTKRWGVSVGPDVLPAIEAYLAKKKRDRVLRYELLD